MDNDMKAWTLFRQIFIAIALSPLFAITTVFANTANMNINISGTVIANGSCAFNQGGALQVDFGDVKLQATGTDTVALEGNYLKPLTSNFTCSGDTAGLLQMKFISSTGAYGTYNGVKVLAVDKGIVAIQMLVNNAAKNMNEWFNVDQQNPPVLEVQLVQISNTNTKKVVSGDLFSASGTLMMAFN